jgi:hypothetical protein
MVAARELKGNFVNDHGDLGFPTGKAAVCGLLRTAFGVTI